MDIKNIAQKINNSGGKVYLVGGAARDIILGKTPKDYDYCITGLSQKEFKEILPDAIIRGKEFPVFDLYGTEFALARKERKISTGHNGFEIQTDKSYTICDDLFRRDITINSIAIDVLTNEVIDPFNGIEDCKNKIIRAISDAFSEDPLRVYRVARFASQLNFNIDLKTYKLMESLKNELKTLSAERVFTEFRKALISDYPVNFFRVLRDINCLDVHFEEINDLIGIIQPINYHPEGDVYNHTMEVLKRAREKTNNELILFAALVHDFGKIATPKELLPHHYNHENNGDDFVIKFCNRLKMPTNYKKVGLTSCHEHMKAGIFNNLKSSSKVDFLVKNSKTILGLDGLEIIANSDKERNQKIKFAELGKRMLKEVNGKSIKINEDNYAKLKEKIRQERITWINDNK